MKIILYFLVLVSCNICLSQSASHYIQAGAARINITPELPIRMSGYGNRTSPFEGIHDSIYARAIVFADMDKKMVIISADVIGFSHSFVDKTKSMIQVKSGIGPDNILVTAAHNHGGPVTSVYLDDATSEEQQYFDWLKKQLVLVVMEADESIQPVSIGAGEGTCKMNVNRRAQHAEGGIWLGRNPAGPCDHEVGVVRIDGQNGNPIAVLVNWPCHATIGGQENVHITGDWPGATAGKVENDVNGAVVLITAGASADINPIYGPNNNFQDIKAVGDVLSMEINRIINKITTQPQDQIKMINQDILAEGKKPSPSRMPNVALEKAPEMTVRLSTFKIGHIVFAGVSGELMTEIGMDVKVNSPYKHTYLLTHCNGSNGYLCTDKAYKEGGYEPMVSRTMPGTAEKIRSAFKEMTGRL